jgi:hypothetical protein
MARDVSTYAEREKKRKLDRIPGTFSRVRK